MNCQKMDLVEGHHLSRFKRSEKCQIGNYVAGITSLSTAAFWPFSCKNDETDTRSRYYATFWQFSPKLFDNFFSVYLLFFA